MEAYKSLIFIILIIFLFLTVTLFDLQINNYEKYQQAAQQNFLRKKKITPMRGEIFDRNFDLIAKNDPAINLYFIPGYIADKDKLIDFVTKNFAITKDDFKDKIYKNRFRTYKNILLVNDLSYSKVASISEKLNYFPSLNFDYSSKRVYSFDNNFTGYVDEINREEYKVLKKKDYSFNDIIGKAGLERQYEKYLKGKNGYKIQKFNAYGKKIEFFQDDVVQEPVNGYDLILTIDSKYQEYLYSNFGKKDKGCIVVMDTNTGGILAYVNYPAYNPNYFVGRTPKAIWDSLSNDERKPMLDRISAATYPPGSVFKPITASIGLEDNIVTQYTKLAECTGSMEIGNRFVKCWNKFGHGKTNVIQAMTYSCDVYFYDLSLKISMERFREYVLENHITEKMGIDLPFERNGFFPTAEWYRNNYGRYVSLKGQKVNLSIGQGEVLLTPLQVCSYYAALANNRYYKRPHLLDKMIGEKTIYYNELNEYEERKIPLSDKNYEIIKKSLFDVVNTKYGTGKSAYVPGVKVYGKTGSAENHMGELTHAWFACYAEWDEPEIAVVVFKENAGHGGSQAGPLAQKAISYYNKHMRE